MTDTPDYMRPHVIDVNCSFGMRLDDDPRYSLEALSAELDWHKVALAFTYSQQGLHYFPQAANDETITAALNNPRFLPVAVINPAIGNETLREVIRCLQAGVRAFRIFPDEHGWAVDSLFFREVLETLRGSGAVLFITVRSWPDGWRPMGEISKLTAGLGISVVLMDTSYGNMAELIAVMHTYPHVYAETNRMASSDAIELMVEAVGADRLLYGSYSPLSPMQKALNQVLEAPISAEEKMAILCVNAMSLLNITPAQLEGRQQLDSLEPKTFSEEIIDVHSHLGYWSIPTRNANYDPTAMLARMKRYGIKFSVVSSYEGMRYNVASANANLAKAIEGHPELLGYVELNPAQLKLSCEQMDKYYSQPNFVGCEIELDHIDYPTSGKEVRSLLAEVAKRGKPVLLRSHLDPGDAELECELVRQNPGLVIINAHGINAEWARKVKDTPDIYVEFNRSWPSHLWDREVVDILGPNRVLFGTDQTLLSVGAMIGLYWDMRLTPDERRHILSENARRLFGLGTQ